MEIGTVKATDIREEMQTAYLDYAMSVITARALPDVRDGLKPVQRRILFQMKEMGLVHNAAHRKCARIVGDVLGRFHPHGDQSVYDALVRLAQDFTMRYPLVDGQGNFGSIDGDPPAAMRYTEARLTELAEALLADIDHDTVDFRPNFDDTLKEPVVLPAQVPNLLVNGANGIAVGMATLIPPHNLGEICDAIAYLVDHWNKIDEVEPDDLMQFVKGPDFPTGGIILGTDGIKEAYATGKGRLVVRGRIHTEPISGGRSRIVVSEIPYQVNKSSLIERIAELVREKKVEEIGDLRDESDRQGMSIVIELKRGVEATPVINALLKYTSLQSTFSVNMLALVDGEPRVLSLKRALQLFVQHRQVVITRRTQFELERAKMRAHILEGLAIALNFLDEVIRLIRQSPDADTARERLMKRFKLSELQATAILDMQLRRLAALERKKIEDELAEVRKRIKYLEDLLRSPKRILGVIQEECRELKSHFGDARRTLIVHSAETEFTEQAHAEEGEALVTLTRGGVLHRSTASQYRRTRSDALNGVQQREQDPPERILVAANTDNLLLFTNQGRALPLKMTQVPDILRNPNGLSLANQLASGERFVGLVSLNGEGEGKFVTLGTTGGKIKRTPIEEFSGIQVGGAKAMNLAEGDELGWATISNGGGEFIIVTAQGQALRFMEEEIPVQGRIASGVWAIKLAEGDRVVSVRRTTPDRWLVVGTERGYVKRVPMKEFPIRGRYTGGVNVITLDSRTGAVADAQPVALDDDVLFVATNGLTVRVRAENIAKGNRNAKGKQFLNLKEADRLVLVTSLESNGKGETEKRPAGPTEAGERRKEAVKGTPTVSAAKGNGHSEPSAEKLISVKPVKPSSPAKKKQKAPAEQKPVRNSKRPKTSKQKDPTARAKPEAEEAEQLEMTVAAFKPLPKREKKAG